MIRTRLAPSPTGNPHIATIFQALINFIYAKKHNGHFIVRIEDTDKKRQVQNAEQIIFKALKWFDLNPDESPIHSGPNKPYRQSERLDIYKKYTEQLIDAGHAYYCFCSQDRLKKIKEEMKKQNLPPMYDKHCRNIDLKKAKQRAKSEPHVVRLKVPENKTIIVNDLLRGPVEFDSNIVDDQIILKSDGYPTYHLALIVDDHLMKITHMIRGEEWLSSAPKHVLLYQFFNWKPPVFIHTPILRNPDHSKLSKRQGHTSVNWYIEQGYLKEAILNFLITRVWNHPQKKEVFDIKELIKSFKLEKINTRGPVVDLSKLDWFNTQWIKKLSDNELFKRLKSFKHKDLSNEKLKQIVPLIKQRIKKLSELKYLTEYFIKEPKLNQKQILEQSETNKLKTIQYLEKVIDTISKISKWNVINIETLLKKLQKDSKWEPRQAFMTMRLIITGRLATPPLFNVIHILSKKTTIKRLNYAKKVLS